MLGGFFHSSPIVVVDGQSTDHTVISSFLKHHYTIAHRLTFVFRYFLCFLGLCQKALFSVCPVYGKEKLFSLGPQLFLRDLGAMLVKRELITDCPPEVGALTAPERLYAAHALYRDARVCCDPELRTAYSRHLSPAVLFRDMFCFGAALRLYYQSFGIGFRMHKKMRGTGFTDNPVLETSLGKAVGNAGRKAAGSLLKSGAFYKLPWLFLTVLSGRLGAALGNWYHRLPASVNRKLAGGRYF